MALTERQIENITADVVNLTASLKAADIDTNTARIYVGNAMMAIVMTETDPPAPPQAEHFAPLVFGGRPVAGNTWPSPEEPGRAGKSNLLADQGITWPTEEQAGAKQDQLRRERARWGNVDPATETVASRSIIGRALEQLMAEPEEGQDVRLVKVYSPPPANPQPGEDKRRQAMRWVRENVPEAGPIRAAEYAGTTGDGFPVYLVTYELKPPTQSSPLSGN